MTYLIITRLKEFWPPYSPAVMMGPWCLPLFDGDKKYPIDQCEMLPSPWPGNSELEQSQVALDEIYAALLPKLTEALNKFHNVSYPNRYWQILVGPWLMYFVHVMYDKIIRLETAIKSYPDLKIVGLSPEYYRIPVITVDFASWVNHDELYNLQLITRLIENMDIRIESFRIPETKAKPQEPPLIKQKPSTKLRVFEYFQRKLLSYAKVVVYDSYHPKKFLAKLLLVSRGKIVELDHYDKPFSNINLDVKKRHEFDRFLKADNSSNVNNLLQSRILKMLSKELPLIFLEGYCQLETTANQNFGAYEPEIICSATGWYFAESFKCWSAKLACKSSKLYGLQHGGNYGISYYTPCEDHEMSITDKYFTWGWGGKNLEKQNIPTPAQKLVELQRRNDAGDENTGILYAVTAGSRHLIQFSLLPDHFQHYLNWQKRFLSTLSETKHSLMRIRLHNEDNIWEIGKRLKNVFPTLTFENWDRSFSDSISNCRIFVCDHLSTTYAEALASNTPTVIFWDPKITRIRLSAQPFFEDLRRVGIFHDTPESAAMWVEKIYSDVGSWWNSKECQQAVDTFCRNYARVSRFSLWKWFKILNKFGD